GRWSDASIRFGDQLFGRKHLIWGISPELPAHTLMHPFCECFCEPIREGFHQNGGVVIIRPRETLSNGLLFNPGRNHEAAKIVPTTRRQRGDEISESQIRPLATLSQLLPESIKGGKFVFAT